MSSCEIAVIAPDKELFNLLTNLSNELKTEFSPSIHVVMGFLDEGVTVAHNLKKEGFKVLVSRGGTTTKLRNSNINLPIIDIPITEYDVIKILDKARQISTKIAVIGFDSLIRGTEIIAPILGIQVENFLVQSEADVEPKVQEAKKMGMEVIVGAKLAVECAQALGLHSILLKSHKKPVLTAIKEAQKVLEALHKEREWGERVRTILDSIHEGIISVDKNGKIIHCNKLAHKVMEFENLGTEKIAGEGLFIKSGLANAIKNGEKWVGEIREFFGTKYVININPLSFNQESLGAIIVFQELSDLQTLEQRVRRNLYQKGHVAKHEFKNIIWRDPLMEKVIDKAQKYAQVDSTVLIQGESGTGKEMFAQSFHNASSRSGGPFVAINCAVLPENLLESELFGYVEGAFTGARKGGKAGLFELAHGGTLFLDEIGEISAAVQARLLRVLEERRIMRIGDDKVIPIDVRVICATNRGLQSLVKNGKFREDLFYRINILKLELPPLRSRQEDIPLLVNHFFQQISKGLRKKPPQISSEGMILLRNHHWPGNIRELRNVVERLIINANSEELSYLDLVNVIDDLPDEGPNNAKNINLDLNQSLVQQQEIKLILEVLAKTNGNKAEAARQLGISTTTLWRKLKRNISL